jgi:hypothetical protein
LANGTRRFGSREAKLGQMLDCKLRKSWDCTVYIVVVSLQTQAAG